MGDQPRDHVACDVVQDLLARHSRSELLAGSRRFVQHHLTLCGVCRAMAKRDELHVEALLLAARRRLQMPLRTALAGLVAVALLAAATTSWVAASGQRAVRDQELATLFPGWLGALRLGAAEDLSQSVSFGKAGTLTIIGVWPKYQGTIVAYFVPRGRAGQALPARQILADGGAEAWPVPSQSVPGGTVGAWVLPPQLLQVNDLGQPSVGRLTPTLRLVLEPVAKAGSIGVARGGAAPAEVTLPIQGSVIRAFEHPLRFAITGGKRAFGVRAFLSGPDGLVASGAWRLPIAIEDLASHRPIPHSDITFSIVRVHGQVYAFPPTSCRYRPQNGWTTACLFFTTVNTSTHPYSYPVSLAGPDGAQTQIVLGGVRTGQDLLVAPPSAITPGTGVEIISGAGTTTVRVRQVSD